MLSEFKNEALTDFTKPGSFVICVVFEKVLGFAIQRQIKCPVLF